MRKRRTSAPSEQAVAKSRRVPAALSRLGRLPSASDRPTELSGGEEPESLQAQLKGNDPRRAGGGVPDDDGTAPGTDAASLILQLESQGRFRRDRGLGRIFHLGRVSLREIEPSNSLHVSVHGNRLTAHVDRVSPVGTEGERTPRYSLRRAVTHNLQGMAHDLVRLARGRQGDHRSQLNCEWVSDPSEVEPDERDLLDPRAATWSVQLEVRVTGSFDEERLRDALQAVLGGSSLERDPLEVVECADDGALEAARTRLLTEVVWPHKCPPLHAYLAHHPDGDVLMFNLNHAAADGFAALRVLDCLATAYARGSEPVQPLDFLATRQLPVRPTSAPVWRLIGAYQARVERLRDWLASPARLAADGATDEAGCGFHLVRLSPEDTGQVLDAERPGRGRDMLLAGLHRAIGEWNLQRGIPGRQVGVLVPVNLRPSEWNESNIGNFSVTTRVSTRRRHRSHPSVALKAVTSQTNRNKRTRTGVALVAALDRTALLPLWAKQSLVVLQPLTRNRLVDTAMLTHLGGLPSGPTFGLDAGETVELWFSVPARAPLALSIGAVGMAGRLHLTFRYPRRLFSADAARRFADCYVAHVRSIAEARL